MGRKVLVSLVGSAVVAFSLSSLPHFEKYRDKRKKKRAREEGRKEGATLCSDLQQQPAQLVQDESLNRRREERGRG